MVIAVAQPPKTIEAPVLEGEVLDNWIYPTGNYNVEPDPRYPFRFRITTPADEATQKAFDEANSIHRSKLGSKWAHGDDEQ